jgi:hypothetical protein
MNVVFISLRSYVFVIQFLIFPQEWFKLEMYTPTCFLFGDISWKALLPFPSLGDMQCTENLMSNIEWVDNIQKFGEELLKEISEARIYQINITTDILGLTFSVVRTIISCLFVSLMISN